MKLNLPVIILNGTFLLPQNELKLEFTDDLSKNIIEESEFFHDNKLLIVTKLTSEENISLNELPKIGTLCEITRKLELPNGKTRIILKGITRASVLEYLSPSKYIISSFVSIKNKDNISSDVEEALIKKLYSEVETYVEKVPYMSNSLLSLIMDIKDLNVMTDIVINHMKLESKRIFEYLFELDSTKRLEMILEDIYKEEQLYNIEKHIDTKVKKELDKDQKDFYLKEKIRHLKSEIGEYSKKEEEIEKLKSKVDNLNVSNNIKDKLYSEIERYENTSSISPEISSIRNYINTLLKLPWNKLDSDIIDFKQIKSNLDKTHYGLSKVKERILEYLIVKKRSPQIESPILCLIGPPGVGKTSFAYSIASSIGRKFVKVSLGGVDDYSYIKGHTRTYMGAQAGCIIDGIIRAESSNPIFLIDEIDKMCSNYKGDPSSALLEVLDITQNKHFKDNYIEEEYDLSNVIFIITANSIDNIPLALRDRLEIINIDGYTDLEKLKITKEYLIPRMSLKYNVNNIKIKDEDILNIVKYYTKESGVRDLSRLMDKIVRKIIAEKIIDNKKVILNIKDIEKYLGKRIYNKDVINNNIGVTNALAYTYTGGDIQQIESNYFDGTGNLILTGSMGDVMLDSAKIALSYIKANYKLFKIDKNIFNSDIHINIPNISQKKDGPSAGIAIVTSLISTLINLKIPSNIAYTGEITLRGDILKVGGIKEKVMGAYINNIDTIFIPELNKDDLADIDIEIKEKIKFILVKNYMEVYNYILEEANVQ